MTPDQKPAYGTIIQINAKLLYALFLAALAYFSWPTNPKWWGFGFISVTSGLASLGLIIEAIRAMAQLFTRDKVMAEYMAQGNKPKSSDLTSEDALKDAGMR
ncbi:MAG: hypothetical protein JKY32_16865 [Rhizobiales bacterium]|nr:hypothetical protein [Hyphomicrobiales bacterium]